MIGPIGPERAAACRSSESDAARKLTHRDRRETSRGHRHHLRDQALRTTGPGTHFIAGFEHVHHVVARVAEGLARRRWIVEHVPPLDLRKPADRGAPERSASARFVSLTVSPTLRSAGSMIRSTRPRSMPVRATSSFAAVRRPRRGSPRFTESIGCFDTGTVIDARATMRSRS